MEKKTNLRREYLGLDLLLDTLKDAKDAADEVAIAAGDVFDLSVVNKHLKELIGITQESINQIDDMRAEGYFD
jgi:hypothetical protein